METNFGSSSAAEVLEIRIPLYSASSEEKEENTKQYSCDKKKSFSPVHIST